MIKRGLEHGYNVVVDATNLNPKSLNLFQELVMYHNVRNYEINPNINSNEVKIEYKMFHINVEEAIIRDKDRKRTVGAQVIRGFYNRYKEKLEN